ncbi:hypothetical protein TCAL_17077 [Tigriopus californicus]|uniref:Uncharacterized protein n=1 Tax=Tigriopus californicus TaxID=6832 RepID=A0A553PQ96_TIGCA|nr:hypothetical protein TCAL_17077 [Tigriopus californicus]
MNQSAMVQFSGRKEDCPDAYSTFQSLQEDVVPANERQGTLTSPVPFLSVWRMNPEQRLKWLLDAQDQLLNAAFGSTVGIDEIRTEPLTPDHANGEDSLTDPHAPERMNHAIDQTITALLAQCQYPLPYEALFPLKDAKHLVDAFESQVESLQSINVLSAAPITPSVPIPGTEVPKFAMVIQMPQPEVPRPQISQSPLIPRPKPRSVPANAKQAASKRRMAEAIMAEIPCGIKRSRMRAGFTPVKPPPKKREDWAWICAQELSQHYDRTHADEYTPFPPLKRVHNQFEELAAFGSKLIVVGNTRTYDALESVQIYEPKTRDWVFGPDLLHARIMVAIVTLNSTSVMAVAGQIQGHGSLLFLELICWPFKTIRHSLKLRTESKMEMLSIGDSNWTALADYPEPVSRTSCGTVIFPNGTNGVLCIGGKTPMGFYQTTNAAYFFDLANLEWKRAPEFDALTGQVGGRIVQWNHEIFYKPDLAGHSSPDPSIYVKDLLQTKKPWTKHEKTFPTAFRKIIPLKIKTFKLKP